LRDRRRFIACSGQRHEGIAREYQPPVEDYRSNIRKEVELEKEDGLYVYELEIVDYSGEVWELELDAKTGELVELENEDD
ncbi:hypothetical protein LCGC14_1531770, partial [marine sediment metagenome]